MMTRPPHCSHPERSKLFKEMRVDRGDTSLDSAHSERSKLFKEMRVTEVTHHGSDDTSSGPNWLRR